MVTSSRAPGHLAAAAAAAAVAVAAATAAVAPISAQAAPDFGRPMPSIRSRMKHGRLLSCLGVPECQEYTSRVSA